MFSVFTKSIFYLVKNGLHQFSPENFPVKERYVIFMKNKENHGENELNVNHLNDKKNTAGTHASVAVNEWGRVCDVWPCRDGLLFMQN